MDEEEELENTLIGQQQEEAPAMDAGDALMGAGQPMPTMEEREAAAGLQNTTSSFGQPMPTMSEREAAAGLLNTMAGREATDVSTSDALMGNVNFRDYSVPEPPRASALSVFTPSGDLKPGIDVNAITPSPTTLPTPSVVNTALNQEIPVGLPSVQDSFDRSAVRSGRSRAGEGGQDALGDFISSFEFQGRRGQRTGDSSVVQTPTATAQSFFGQAPASNAAEAAQRLIGAGPAFTQGPAQAPELDPNSDEAILVRRAAREAEFLNAQPTAPRSDLFPNDPGVQRTRNELMRRFGAPTIREIQEQDAMRRFGGGATPAPAAVNNFAPQASGGQIRDLLFRGDPGSNVRPLPSNPDAGFSPRPPSLREPDAGFTPRPLPNDPTTTGPGNVRDMLYRNPVPNLSDFERESIARQIRSGGTGSFAGDSAALQARLAERDRLPGETQTERDTRIARSRTQGSSRGGLSQADARDLAQGMARGATEGERARALQIQSRLGLGQFEPERELTDLEKREIESRISAREAEIARSETKADFQPRLIDVGGERAIELSPGYFQRIPKDTPNKTGLQKTLENLQADLDSGRLTQEEYDIATKNARDLYIGREEPKPVEPEETSGLIAMDDEAPVATETAPQTRVTINTQAEYDALAVGTPYIDSQGTPGIKK